MKISLFWLKEYIDVKLSAQELSHRLTLSGLEVEKQETLNGDAVFELEITPNRPDCLSLLGIGRELSAILDKPLKKPAVKKIKLPKVKAAVTITDAKDCRRYIGAVLNDVRVAASAKKIQDHLLSVGIRSINNIVDITNFCLMECGQPMHAFDLDKLDGGKIIVRRAKAGEKITAINDVEYTLDPSVLVIADNRKAVAIAGIMGGKETEVTEATTNVLLESAWFDPLLVRRASRKLGLRSEASYRFERGVDMPSVESGCLRAIDLIMKESGAKLGAYRDAGFPNEKILKPKPVVLDVAKAARFLGTPISISRAKNILTKLEFKVSVKAQGKLSVSAPSFRSDIRSDVDLVEEIARVMGFDKLSLRLSAIDPVNIPTDERRTFREKLSSLCVAQGCHEIISYTTVSLRDLESAQVSKQGLVYNQNFLSEDQQVLRPSLLPSLIKVAGHNIKNGQKALRLFETGKIYLSSQETEVLAIGLSGQQGHDWRSPGAGTADFYDLKGILENVCAALGIEGLLFVQGQNPSLETSENARIILDGAEIGFAGKVKREVLSCWDIKHQDVFFAQILVDDLKARGQKTARAYTALSPYPGVVRDVSLALKKEISYQSIRQAVFKLREPLLKRMDLVEQYLGDKIPTGQKGITISLTYQSPERTLTDAQVEEAHQRICQNILDDLQAVKR